MDKKEWGGLEHKHNYQIPVTLSPRGQAGLEAKILSSASASRNCPRLTSLPTTTILYYALDLRYGGIKQRCNPSWCF